MKLDYAIKLLEAQIGVLQKKIIDMEATINGTDWEYCWKEKVETLRRIEGLEIAIKILKESEEK